MFRVIIASCDAQNLPHWSYLPLSPMYKKWFLASGSFTIWCIMMKLRKNYRSNKSTIHLNLVITRSAGARQRTMLVKTNVPKTDSEGRVTETVFAKVVYL